MKAGPFVPGAGGLEPPPPNDCQTVVCFFFNLILNEKE